MDIVVKLKLLVAGIVVSLVAEALLLGLFVACAFHPAFAVLDGESLLSCSLRSPEKIPNKATGVFMLYTRGYHFLASNVRRHAEGI